MSPSITAKLYNLLIVHSAIIQFCVSSATGPGYLQLQNIKSRNYQNSEQWKCLGTFFTCSARSSLLCGKVITVMKSSSDLEPQDGW